MRNFFLAFIFEYVILIQRHGSVGGNKMLADSCGHNGMIELCLKLQVHVSQS